MKRIKKFFGNLFPKKKRTSRKKSMRKLFNKQTTKDLLGFSFLESKKAKIGIGIGAAVLLLVMVFWGTPEMDNLLRFFGIKAFGDVTIEVTPMTGESAYPEGSPPINQAFYNVKVTPAHNEYGYNVMTVDLEALDVWELLPLVNQEYVASVQFFYKDTVIDARHLEFYDNDTTPVDLDLIITTTGDAPLSDKITFFIVEGYVHTDSKDPEPGLNEWSVSSPWIELILLAEAPSQPDFSMRIEPVTTVVVDGGTPINYIIYITNLDGFRDTVTLSSTDLLDLLYEGGTWPPYLTGIHYPDGLSVDFSEEEDNTELSLRLTLDTTSDPTLLPGGFSFVIVGNDIPEKFVAGTVMLLEPPPAPNFAISVTYEGIIHDDRTRIVVVPGNSLDFTVTVNRLNGWTGPGTTVTAVTDLLTGWPLDIDSATFVNNGIFDDGTGSESTILTVTIKDTCVVTDESNIIFTVTGYGDIDGDTIYEERTDSIEFSIVDLTVTILDTPQTVTAGVDAVYEIQLRTLNDFNDDGSMRLIENFVADYPNDIDGFDFNLDISASRMTGNLNITYICVTIHTKESSDGATGIPFRAEVRGIATELVRVSNEGILNITSQQDFTIQVTPLKNRVIPGGEATYSITATGLLGFSDPVDLSTSWDIPNKPDYIDTISFDDAFIVPGNGIPGTPTTLHVVTTLDAPPISSQDPEGQFRVFGISGTNPIRFDDAGLDIVDFTIKITVPVPNMTGDSIRLITSGEETTYLASITRMNDLFEDITLSTDLVSTKGSINSLTFEGPDVVFVGGEYILQYNGLMTQTVTLRVTTHDPIPDETINFYIYGDLVTNEGDPLQRQSNRGVLIITNTYEFGLTIEPYDNTITPDKSAIYTIGVNRLNGFEGNITLVPTIVELEGKQLIYDFNTFILEFDGSDSAILTITSNIDALGIDIDFTVEGSADLSGMGDFVSRSIDGKIIIVDFTLVISEPVDKDIGPGGLVDYTIHLQATGTTTLTETIFLTTNIQNIDDGLNNIVEVYQFIPSNISGLDPFIGVDVTLRVWSFANIPSGVPNHTIPFTVYADCDVSTEHLQKSDMGSLRFTNTPYFILTVTPDPLYSFPGDIAEFNVHIDRYNNYLGRTDLMLTSVLGPLINNFDFIVDGDDRSYLLDGEDDATLWIEVTEDLVLLRTYLHETSLNDDLLVSVTGNESLGGASNTDTAILRIRDFKIEVSPLTTNETYPDSTIQYDVTLTRYNTYKDHDEDIILNSNVDREDTSDHVLSFDPVVNFANGGVFPEEGIPGIYSTIMTVGTTSKEDDLPITISFDVSGTGDTTSLIRKDDNYLTIVSVPDFSLSLSPVTDGRGIPTETVDYIIALTRDPGFTDDVFITDVTITNDETGQPLTQANYQLIDNLFTEDEPDATKDLYITLADDTGYWGDYTVTVEGVGNDITSPRYADAPLVVMDFAIFLEEDTKQITPDSNVSYEVLLSRYNGYDRGVIMSTTLTDLIGLGDIAGVVSTLPDNTFSYTGTDQQSAFMIVYTTPGATEQTIEFKVTGTDNTPTALQRDTTGYLNIITAKDYNLTLAAKNGIDAGMPTETITYVITLEALNNFTGEVDITEILLSNSTNIIDSFEGNDFTLSGDGDTIELHLALGIDILWGDRVVQVKGEGTPGDRYSNEADLHIIDFDIEIDEPKNQSITDTEPNNVATYGITLVRHNNYNRAVTIVTNITPENYPGIISSSIFANGGIFLPGTTTTDLLIYAASSVSDPIHFDVVGTDAPTGLERLDSGSLAINDGVTPDFLINVSPPSITVKPKGSASYSVTVTRINGHNKPILLSTNLKTDNDKEIAQIMFMSSGPDTTTLNVITTNERNSTIPITFIVWGTTDTAERSDSADIIIYKAPDDPVTPPGGSTDPTPINDFRILIKPDERTVLAGGGTSYTVTAFRNGYNGPISLTTDLLTNPEIASAIFEDQTLEPGMSETTLNVYTNSNANSGEITFTVSGNGTPGTRSDAAILNIRKEEEIPELPSTGTSAWIWMAMAIISIMIWAYLIIQKPSTEEE